MAVQDAVDCRDVAVTLGGGEEALDDLSPEFPAAVDELLEA